MQDSKGKRTPRPEQGKVTTTDSQHSISMFMVGRAPANQPHPVAPPNLSAKASSSNNEQSDPRRANLGRNSESKGLHQSDEQQHIAGRQRSPPPDPRVRAKASSGNGEKHRQGSLMSWRIPVPGSTEVAAQSLVLSNPQNLCYANSVIHMLHQARALAGPISGLGALNGALMQAARTDQSVNIARGSAWSFMWARWQRPTRQHAAAEFLQHLCQRTDCTALHGGWEARRQHGRVYEIIDEQFTCPHIRLSLQRPFQIQDAIQQWHNQETVHALTKGTVRERMCLCMYATDPLKPRLERDIRFRGFSL